MNIYKLIEIDMVAERARINHKGTYNKRQRKALLTLCDLFEAGEWQKCLDFVNDKKNFPRNERYEYPEQEHISPEMSRVLEALGHTNFWTSKQLVENVRQSLK